MIDGVAAMSAMWFGMMAQGRWRDEPGTNFTDAGAPYYDVYETSDHRHVAVAALEEPFYRELPDHAGSRSRHRPAAPDPERWPELAELLGIGDANPRRVGCVRGERRASPVLSLTEAPEHPHHVARHVRDARRRDAAPRTAVLPQRDRGRAPTATPGEHTGAVLRDWGLDAAVAPCTPTAWSLIMARTQPGSRGRPRIRSPTTLRWISLAPP